MKYLIATLIALVAFGCQNKKMDTAVAQDTTVVAPDSIETAEVIPLAFSPVDGFNINKKAALPDTLNFFILANSEELKENFEGTGLLPDFIINYTIAIARKTPGTTTLEVTKVELAGSTINVYAEYKNSPEEKQSGNARIYAVERRDGIVGIDFYVNGKVASKMMMPGV